MWLSSVEGTWSGRLAALTREWTLVLSFSTDTVTGTLGNKTQLMIDICNIYKYQKREGWWAGQTFLY